MNPTPPPPPDTPNQPENLEDNLGMRMLLPVGRSGYAVAAGYLGLISLLIIPSPFALTLGILGIVDIRRSRSEGKKKYGMGRAVFGVIAGAIGTAVLLALIIRMIAG